MQANLDIRHSATQAGVKLWQIADRLNINDGNLSRKLRRELSWDEKQRILGIIEDLKAGEQHAS